MWFFERRPARSDGPEGECAEAALRRVAAASASIIMTYSGTAAGQKPAVTLRCDLCHYDKSRYPKKLILKCAVSRPCQKIYADLYPEGYYNEDGTPVAERVECEGAGCLAVLRCTSDDGRQPQLTGECLIDQKNQEWQTDGQYFFARDSAVHAIWLAEQQQNQLPPEP